MTKKMVPWCRPCGGSGVIFEKINGSWIPVQCAVCGGTGQR